MRVISLWQPWATAIALGSKRVETRSWSTSYRGPLAIHASKRCVISELIDFRCTYNWKGALKGTPLIEDHAPDYKTCLPFGAVVAVCDLIDCKLTDYFTVREITERHRAPGEDSEIYDWTEGQMGNFALGRYGWVLDKIRPLATPLPWKGSQGFFDVPDNLLLSINQPSPR